MSSAVGTVAYPTLANADEEFLVVSRCRPAWTSAWEWLPDNYDLLDIAELA